MTEPASDLGAVCMRDKTAALHRGPIAVLLLLALTGSIHAQQSAPPKSPGDDYTISVNVDVVVLHATAQDHQGNLVSGLGKNDFQIYEDGVLQTIKYFSHEDIPVTIGLVVDNSGSMRPKRADVIAAALAFARSSNPHDQMFVVNFNEKVSFGLPKNVAFTDQVVELEAALSRIAADGETALYDAVATALDRRGARVERGEFGADMRVESVNDGPVTLVLDSRA